MDTTLPPAHLRFKDYKGDHCWQYEVRIRNLDNDIEKSKFSLEEIQKLRVKDFYFSYVDKEDKGQCKEVKKFIEENEYLGKLPNRPTQRFCARTKKHDELAGVIIMAVPNTFSLLLGEEYKHREKLISRGASISWSPPHLGSWLIMNSIRWMTKNTHFVIYSAYSDPEAKELGTLYQSCNFFYLHQASGTIEQYFDPDRPEYGWFSSRNFRHRSKYTRYAKELGIELQKEWWGKYTLKWNEMPENLVLQLKNAAKEYQARCWVRKVATKHKYAYIAGKDRRETRYLRKRFAQLNPSLVGLEYPQTRGE